MPGCYCWLFNEDKEGFQTRVTHEIVASIYQTTTHWIKWLLQGLGVRFLGRWRGEGEKGRVKIHQSYKNLAKKSCETQSPSDQIMPILRLVHASKMGDVVKTESLLFSRDHPLPREWCFTSSWASCSAPAACQVPLIVTLFWCVLLFFFPLFLAESEGAGCVLLHTSRKVSRGAVWPVWFFHHAEVQKRIVKHTCHWPKQKAFKCFFSWIPLPFFKPKKPHAARSLNNFSVILIVPLLFVPDSSLTCYFITFSSPAASTGIQVSTVEILTAELLWSCQQRHPAVMAGIWFPVYSS